MCVLKPQKRNPEASTQMNLTNSAPYPKNYNFFGVCKTHQNETLGAVLKLPRVSFLKAQSKIPKIKHRAGFATPKNEIPPQQSPPKPSQNIPHMKLPYRVYEMP